ncbi:MAG: outer membrane beta-barrel protein [Rhodopseudomonas sp.]|nr:outer membrane beta-barrel protein [Rhodopseudomonas sp.]
MAIGTASTARPALAQTVPEYLDPLAPKLSTDPRKPPRFQRFGRSELVELGPPSNFTPPPSAAGDTGYDATNSRRAKAKARLKSGARRQSAEASADRTPIAATVSPYQMPYRETVGGTVVPPQATPDATDLRNRKNRLRRKAADGSDDPYAPLGVRAGAFTLFPAVELSGGYATNPQQTADPKGASIYTIAPELKAQSNWSRHELKAELRGSYTGYSPDAEPTLSRPNVNGKVDGRIDVTKTTRVDLGGRVLVSTDNPGSPNLQAGLAKLPIYSTVGGSVGLGRKFNRVDLSVKGDVERTSYQDSTLVDGTTASNKDRNYDQYGVTLRGGYELTPGVTAFVEGRYDTRTHDEPVDSSGYRRDSKGVTGKFGTTFELTRQLTGEISAGMTRRDYDDARLDSLTGLIGDASLVWTASALTTVKITAASSVGETTIAGASGILYRDAGVEVDHAFRRWLIGSIKLGIGLDDYEGTSREDNRYSAGFGLTYKLNRTVSLKGDFRQDWLRSNIAGNDYTASVFMLGVRVQR